MLIIETKVKETENRGLGLFTINKISKGTVISVENETFSKSFSKDEVEGFNDTQKQFIKIYCIFDGERYHLDLDNLRYCNHSNTPNISFIDAIGVTLRDIEEGEELFCDYTKIGDIEYKNGLDFEVK